MLGIYAQTFMTATRMEPGERRWTPPAQGAIDDPRAKPRRGWLRR
ncbi:hypothetical protein [Salipiger abyssi]|uniref:Uncharacterized protein n=1 Tax=Salipiger abyssi TaxID=1250539 RepID=A0A1P8UVV7_9RHOB|nr:hypothetical protein [Salipiger abyssi]APZ53529.1 hypothetical protein Ga0080574_TMP3195 [Salipiger abyssi]